MLLTIRGLLLHRLGPLAIACGGFAILYVAARQFTGDYGLIGLSDNAVRSIAHFTVFGGLALLMAKALFGQYLLCWVISVLLATGDEIHQLFIKFRFAGIEDWLINGVGISTFLLAGFLLDQLHCGAKPFPWFRMAGAVRRKRSICC